MQANETSAKGATQGTQRRLESNDFSQLRSNRRSICRTDEPERPTERTRPDALCAKSKTGITRGTRIRVYRFL